MAVALPLVPSVPNYRVSTQLGDRQFIFDVRWNARDGAWYLDISTEADEPLRTGIKLVLGTILGVRSADPRMPQGALVCCDLTGAGLDATLDDLGTRVAVIFYTFDELQ